MTENVVRDCRHPRANHQHGTHLAALKDGCRCVPCVKAMRRNNKLTAYRTATGTHTYVDAGPARAHVKRLLRTLTVAQIEQRSGVHRTAIRVLVGDVPNRPASKRITRTTAASLLAVEPTFLGPEAQGLVSATGTVRRMRALVAIGYSARRLEQLLGLSKTTVYFLTSRPDRRPLVSAATRTAVVRLYDRLSMTPAPPSRSATIARNHATREGWLPPLAWDDDTIDSPELRVEVRAHMAVAA